MKKLIIIGLCLISIVSWGLDIVTLNGKVYKDVKISNITKIGIEVTNKKGVAFIRFDNLELSLVKKYKPIEKQSPASKTDIKVEKKSKKEVKKKEDLVEKILKTL